MMKTKSIFVIAVVLLLASILSLSACSSSVRLTVPQGVRIDADTLKWETVPYASGYEVDINGEIVASKLPYYSLSSLDEGDYIFKVRAVGEGNYSSSDYSEEVEFKKTGSNTGGGVLTRLATPLITAINGEGVIFWRTVSGAMGYRIYIDNTARYTVSGSSTNSYILDITESGSYSVQVQAMADPTKNLDSNKSTSYEYIIDSDGNPRLPMLAKPTISYDPSKKALYWSKNILSAGYIVNMDGSELSDSIFETIGNYVYYTLQLDSSAEFSIKAVGDGIAYGDSPYSDTIAFPITVAAPPQELSVGSVEVEGTARLALSFEASAYSVGYRIVFNGTEYDISNNYFLIEELDAPDGIYLVKVRSMGDDIYYLSSPYSAEICVTVKDGALLLNIDTPTAFSFAERHLEWEAVEYAAGYTISITDLAIPNARTEYLVADNYFVFGAQYDADYLISIKACAESPFADSLWSIEYPLRFSSSKPTLSAPSGLKYTGDGFEWISATSGILHLLIIDGAEVFAEGESCEYQLAPGAHTVKIKTVSTSTDYYDSVFTEETRIYSPVRLDTPQSQLLNGVLHYGAVERASFYRIYSNDELIADNIFSLSYDLKLAITVDGVYRVAVQAVGETPYADSPRSVELLYIKTDADYGTKTKPIVIQSTEDFLNIVDAPDAYYVIDVPLLDFAVLGKKRELEPLFDTLIPFRGVIIGNGCVIKNINLKEKNGITGIFGALYGARLEGIIFSDITLSGSLDGDNAGIICSQMRNSVIEFVNISAVIDVTGAVNIGAIAGSGEGEITSCNLFVNIKTAGDNIFAGGAAGVFYGEIKNTFIGKQGALGGIEVSGNGTKSAAVTAAFFGNAEGVSSNITVKSEGDSVYIGGLFATAEGAINSCQFSGSIRSSGGGIAYAGGIAAILRGGVSDVTVKGSVIISGATLFYGGIAGYIDFYEASQTAAGITVDELSVDIDAVTLTAGGIFALGNCEAIEDFDVKINLQIDGSGNVGGVAGITDARIGSGSVDAVIALCGTFNAGGVAGSVTGNITDIDLIVSIGATVEDSGGSIGGVAGIIAGNVCGVHIAGAMNFENSSVTAGAVAGNITGDITATIGKVDAKFLISSTADDSIIGGAAGVLNGNLDTDIYIDLDCTTGIIGGAAAIFAGSSDIAVISDITASGGIAGGAFGVLEGEVNGSVQSILTLSKDVVAGGVAGESSAVFAVNATVEIIVNDGGQIFIGGISGKDSGGIAGNVTASLDISALSGYAGGAVGYGEGIYNIQASGGITARQSGTNELYIGGIAGYSENITGEFEGTIHALGKKLYIGGAAGSATIMDGVTVLADIVVEADTLYVGAVAALVQTAYRCLAEGSALELTASVMYAGMFADVGDINEVTVNDLDIVADSETLYCGLLAGKVGSINDSSVGAKGNNARLDLAATNGKIGGAAGVAAADGTFRNVKVYAVIGIDAAGEIYAGGIAGTGGIFADCFAQADITVIAQTVYVGGIASRLLAAETVYFAGKINAHGEAVTAGGFLATGDTDINNCYSSTHLSLEGERVVGALFAADVTGRIAHTYTTGSIVSSSAITQTDYSLAELTYAYCDRLAVFDGGTGIVETLGYGRTVSSGFNYNWELKPNSYPILKDLEGQDTTAHEGELTPFALGSDGALTEYLPYSATDSGIFDMLTWVTADSDILRVIGGRLYRYSAGETVLEGYLSGGSLALSVAVTVEADDIVGAGTDADPYIIDSVKWLHYLGLHTSACFEITEDISVEGYDIFPICTSSDPFLGKLNGNDNTISGLRLNGSVAEAGFFGCIENAEIHALRFENVAFELELTDYAGILAARAVNCVIDNVTAEGSFALRYAVAAGALLGEAIDCIISGTGFNGSISVDNCVGGGLIGLAVKTAISLSYANIIMYSSGDIAYGGLIGSFDTDSTVCDSYAATFATLDSAAQIGGFAYAAYGTAHNCYALFESSGENGAFAYIGGGVYTECYAIPRTFGISRTVVEGNGTGIELCLLIDALGNLFESPAWTKSADTLPRLAEVAGQSAVVEPMFVALSITVTDTDRLDLSKLIQFQSGSFGSAFVQSSDESVMFFDEWGYAKLTRTTVAGELAAVFTFEGGYSFSVEIIADITENPDFAGGYGTELAPYLIATPEQFEKMAAYSYAHFELANDIALADGYAKSDFAGYLSGKGYTLTLSACGMFASATGSIKDLRIVADIEVIGAEYASIIADTSDDFIVKDIDITYTLTASNVAYVGGLVAYARRTNFDNICLDECVLTASGTEIAVGGIAGLLYESRIGTTYCIENVSGKITIQASCTSGYAGGVVGSSELAIAYIDISADVEIQGSYNVYGGGVAGLIDSCYTVFVENSKIIVSGDTASVYAGGVAGKTYSLHACYVALSDVFAALNVENKYISQELYDEALLYAGGAAGYAASAQQISVVSSRLGVDIIVEGLTSDSDLNVYAGGIIGLSNRIKDSRVNSSVTVYLNGNNNGETSALTAYAGSVTGGANMIKDASAEGILTVIAENGSAAYAGGITGIIAGEYLDYSAIAFASSRTDIIAMGAAAGGIAGKNSAFYLEDEHEGGEEQLLLPIFINCFYDNERFLGAIFGSGVLENGSYLNVQGLASEEILNEAVYPESLLILEHEGNELYAECWNREIWIIIDGLMPYFDGRLL